MDKPTDNQARHDWYSYGGDKEEGVCEILSSKKEFLKYAKRVFLNPDKEDNPTLVDCIMEMLDGTTIPADIKIQIIPYYTLPKLGREVGNWPEKTFALLDKYDLPYPKEQRYYNQLFWFWNWVAINLKHFEKYSDDTMIIFIVCWNDDNDYAKSFDPPIKTPYLINRAFMAPFGMIKKWVRENPFLHLYNKRINESGYPTTRKELDYTCNGNSATSYYVDVVSMTKAGLMIDLGPFDPVWLETDEPEPEPEPDEPDDYLAVLGF